MITRFKKTIFTTFGMALLATGFVACSSDDSNTVNEEKVEQVNSSSEDSSNTVFSYPDCHNRVAVRYGTLKFHRPSTSCYSGFSMCTRHSWVVECWDDMFPDGGSVSQENLNPERYQVLSPRANSAVEQGGLLVLVHEIPGQNQVLFQFSLNILESKDYTPGELDTFVIEEDGFPVVDYKLKKGTYVTEITDTALQVAVDIY